MRFVNMKFDNETSSVEVRFEDDGKDVDELIVTAGGKVVFHMERMDRDHFWMRGEGGGHTIDVHLMSTWFGRIQGRAEADL